MIQKSYSTSPTNQTVYLTTVLGRSKQRIEKMSTASTGDLKILFISRSYPPVVGGIEKHNYEISRGLEKHFEVIRITNSKGKLFLPLFFLFAYFKAIFHRKRYRLILLGDGLLAPLGCILKLTQKSPVVCFTHGLDLTFPSPLYQNIWVRKCLPRLDRLFAVSSATKAEAIKRGIPITNISVIKNGVKPNDRIRKKNIQELESLCNKKITGPTILTLGRLVKRKGHAWFINEVLPNLPKNITYIIAGDGKERTNIQHSIERHNLHSQVILLGEVSNPEKETLFSNCQIFVQPNIKVQGDMEGFGLVTLEACAFGLPVIASNVEGLHDAIQSGKNGILVDEKSVPEYIKEITNLIMNEPCRLKLARKSREYTEKNCSWDAVSSQCAEQLHALLT